MQDTLEMVLQTVQDISKTELELIDKVDSFYNSAWDKLVLIGTLAFGVIGILVPFVIQWYQKKTLKVSEELLKKEIESQSETMKAVLLETVNKELQKKIVEFEHKIEMLNAAMTAKAFHLQGNGQIAENDAIGALADYIVAAENYLKCEDYLNLQSMLTAILDDCISSVSKEQIDDLKISHNCDLEGFLKQLESKDERGTFTQYLRDIRLKIKKLDQKFKPN